MRDFIKERINKYLIERKLPRLNDNFWKWFGNSKVVDKNGNPLIVIIKHHKLNIIMMG